MTRESLLAIQQKLGGLITLTNHDTDKGCIPGTRMEVLQKLQDWIGKKHTSADPSLFWLYGIAGCGKSAISHRLSKSLSDKERLGACFFCKRDDKDHNNPRKVLPTIAYQLACKVAKFRISLSSALENKAALSEDTSVSEQYELLFASIENDDSKDSKQEDFIIVIDALDECGDRHTRAKLISELVKLSKLSWLKIILTSRSESDISGALSSSGISGTDLFGYHAYEDIAVYLESLKSGPMKISSDDCQKLVQASCGLFIWISTVIRFLEREREPEKYLGQILTKQGAAGAEQNLVDMYSTILKAASRNGKDKCHMQTVLAVIHEASLYEPMPFDALSDVLPSINHKLLHSIVDDLSSVVYKDENNHDALRVYHPSFLDFLGDKSKCQDFWVNKHVIREELAKGCLKFMQCNLKFNICDLESSYMKNQDIIALDSRVRDRINFKLKYICYNWLHFIPGDTTNVSVEIILSHNEDKLAYLLMKFLTTPICLFWIEVFTLTSQVQLLCNLIGDLHNSIEKVCT
jgi:hypothetical protein